MVVVNETMARQFWKGEEPLGKRFKFFGDQDYTTVVGVAKDSKYNGVAEDPQNFIYQPLAQNYTPFGPGHARARDREIRALCLGAHEGIVERELANLLARGCVAPLRASDGHEKERGNGEDRDRRTGNFGLVHGRKLTIRWTWSDAIGPRRRVGIADRVTAGGKVSIDLHHA